MNTIKKIALVWIIMLLCILSLLAAGMSALLIWHLTGSKVLSCILFSTVGTYFLTEISSFEPNVFFEGKPAKEPKPKKSLIILKKQEFKVMKFKDIDHEEILN